MSKFFVPVILGTAREGRQTENAAKFVLAELNKNSEIQAELVDVRDFLLGGTTMDQTNSKVKKWQEIASRAHGFAIVSPEYNHGYPGELKILLDSVLDEYHHKPFLLSMVSSGSIGGARGMEQLKLVVLELGGIPRQGLYFSSVGKVFGQSGELLDQTYTKRTEEPFADFLEYLKIFKTAK